MNLSGTFNALRLLYQPSLCMPQMAIPTFNQLPIPLPGPIRAIVLDKDNCFAAPHESVVWPEYREKWNQLLQYYGRDALLVVSNTAGSSDDKNGYQAQLLENNLGVPVLRHQLKKPGCKNEVYEYFAGKNIIDDASQVAVVGDRLFTDIMMANMMGAYGIWISQGVVPSASTFSSLERFIYRHLK